MQVSTPTIAYFSMEIGIEPEVPTYAGGLGILAGDTIRSAADLGLPMAAVTLLHRGGYFYQRLSAQGSQSEEPVRWAPDDFLELLPTRTSVHLDGAEVQLAIWRRVVKGVFGSIVPVYFLDAGVPSNRPEHQALTDRLYGGDVAHRLRQEALLGEGGVRALRALGFQGITRFHLNEGHAALAVIELIEEVLRAEPALSPRDALRKVREHCVFTTHTPVAAGHDRFSEDVVRGLGSDRRLEVIRACGQAHGLNMTELALTASRYINGVALRHGQVSRGMFPHYPIHSITNGVHAGTWVHRSLAALYDRHLPGWREDPVSLRNALLIPLQELWEAHQDAKRSLLDLVNAMCNVGFDIDILTIGFARRATAYKRALLVFQDLERLQAIARASGGIQFIFGGKAHPHDGEGKDIIRRIFEVAAQLGPEVRVVYLANYDMALAKRLCAGVDVWLNTPLRPLEASGTSGMKAALNAVPSLSVRDGWWVEGHIEAVTGWGIGGDDVLAEGEADRADAQSLYEQLERSVIPAYGHDREKFLRVMRNSLALNGSFFNTNRMVWQYVRHAYS